MSIKKFYESRFVIVLSRADLDAACAQAYKRAIGDFKIYENGNSPLPEWKRGSCSVCVEFDKLNISGGMTGIEYVYSFKSWIEKEEDF